MMRNLWFKIKGSNLIKILLGAAVVEFISWLAEQGVQGSNPGLVTGISEVGYPFQVAVNP